jgi:hypothetical protein
MTYKTATVITIANSDHESPRGLEARTNEPILTLTLFRPFDIPDDPISFI